MCPPGRESASRLCKVMWKEPMVTAAEIRATAKRLCFQACTDCESADECKPDENWLKEARTVLEADGPDQPSPPVV